MARNIGYDKLAGDLETERGGNGRARYTERQGTKHGMNRGTQHNETVRQDGEMSIQATKNLQEGKHWRLSW